MMEGRGELTWNSGDKYVGEFKEGNFHGQGKKTFDNGNVYEGEYKENKRDGRVSDISSDLLSFGLWYYVSVMYVSLLPVYCCL